MESIEWGYEVEILGRERTVRWSKKKGLKVAGLSSREALFLIQQFQQVNKDPINTLKNAPKIIRPATSKQPPSERPTPPQRPPLVVKPTQPPTPSAAEVSKEAEAIEAQAAALLQMATRNGKVEQFDVPEDKLVELAAAKQRAEDLIAQMSVDAELPKEDNTAEVGNKSESSSRKSRSGRKPPPRVGRPPVDSSPTEDLAQIDATETDASPAHHEGAVSGEFDAPSVASDPIVIPDDVRSQRRLSKVVRWITSQPDREAAIRALFAVRDDIAAFQGRKDPEGELAQAIEDFGDADHP